MTDYLIAPIEKLQFYMGRRSFEGETVNSSVLNFLGIIGLKNAVSMEALESVRKRKKAIDDPASKTSEQEFHPTRMIIGGPQKIIKTLLAQTRIRTLIGRGVFFEGNVAIEVPSIFQKNKFHSQPVIVRNDIGYAAGGTRNTPFRSFKGYEIRKWRFADVSRG